jgi:hypothetical protein
MLSDAFDSIFCTLAYGDKLDEMILLHIVPMNFPIKLFFFDYVLPTSWKADTIGPF